MKYILYMLLITEVEFFVNSGVKDYHFFPNLPVGEYRVDYKAVLKCNLAQKPLIEMNNYFYKTSERTVQVRGNFTCKIPFDDSLKMHLNMAVKDSIGGWKDNAYIYSSPRACTTLKTMTGVQWQLSLKKFGVNDPNCPIPTGIYTNIEDLSLDDVASYNFNVPKSFFYGTYKVRIYFTNTLGVQVGCVIVVVEIKRPWEIV